GAGNDTMYGDGGSDVMIGGAGDDVMYGGDGNDLFVFGGANDTSVSGSDWINGGADFDTIQLNGTEGWTLTVTNDFGDESVITSDTAQMDDYQDVSGLTGQIDFDDGSTIIFEGVEKVEW
ncbi:MAG: hypothetical protein HWE34_08000, partial [Methylocystaceae bacterium]|nr:hypothetical protein [Methylocystaceae bacterium]